MKHAKLCVGFLKSHFTLLLLLCCGLKYPPSCPPLIEKRTGAQREHHLGFGDYTTNKACELRMLTVGAADTLCF